MAELIITSANAEPEQAIAVSNSAYTIPANFDDTLSVTVPLFAWGAYTVSDGYITTHLTVTENQYFYRLNFSGAIYYKGIFSNGCNARISIGESPDAYYVKNEDGLIKCRVFYTNTRSFYTIITANNAYNTNNYSKLIINITNAWVGDHAYPKPFRVLVTSNITSSIIIGAGARRLELPITPGLHVDNINITMGAPDNNVIPMEFWIDEVRLE